MLEVERKQGSANEVDITDFQSDDVLLIQRDAQTRTRFEFDRVFAQNSSQEEVFSSVQPLCVSVLDGYNICIFAYGQTGKHSIVIFYYVYVTTTVNMYICVI